MGKGFSYYAIAVIAGSDSRAIAVIAVIAVIAERSQ